MVVVVVVVVVYLDLALGHAQGVGQSSSLWSRQVFGLFESFLQSKDLLSGESGSSVFPLPVLVQ